MKNLTLKNITQVCGGEYHGPKDLYEREVSSVTTDSRKVEKDALFIPIVGERVDAHRFIPQVMAEGALATLSERPLEDESHPWILVSSSLEAVKKIAAFYLEGLHTPVVGVTGSVGKTSTKETIASVLSQRYRTLKTLGNFNNELGLPLTVFRLRESDEIAVLEMGISNFGEMSRLGEIARPDTCVITNIGTCHLEFLGDRDGVFRAKTEIFQYLKPDGHIVLNGDDDKLIRVREYQGIQPVFFGLGKNAQVYCDQVQSRGLKGMSCRIHIREDGPAAGERTFCVDIPMPGRHMLYNALAAAAVGVIYGLTDGEIQRGIEQQESISGRFHMIETEKLLIVDDCYNASPMSMKASLDVLQDGSGRRVAILGDMGELGEEAGELHRQVGAYAGTRDLEVCICAGPLARHMAEAARETGSGVQVIYEPDRDSLIKNLRRYIRAGDTVLVKASHFMRFEEVVKALQEL
ncbi:MAG: UDP-N-acetylmuramoyl-tripeptide--D-alanyl-D-alanine ligase [Clostridiales bacterium]|nr:UDP-N-acetylmuramoyl-tripeptide--D-alanyl-D-alanine ligase [Clostridiales bacterium]